MITELSLRNFRGIEKADIPLGKINILTGPNNSGKSSIIYGLIALKNIVINPNQSLDSFLNLGFLNLGGFTQTIFFKDDNKNISLGVKSQTDFSNTDFNADLGKKSSMLLIKAYNPLEFEMALEVSFPYPANASKVADLQTDFGKISINWNGITPTLTAEAVEPGLSEKQKELLRIISLSLTNPLEELRSVDFISLRRGFTKPNYSSVPLQQQLLSDDELATLLATDRDLEGKVATYLEKIIDRSFTVRPTIGTANFNLQSRDRSTGLVSDLVNEGFGTNQLVTILTKTLRKEVRTVCVEELEIHLHPELMNKVINALIELAYDENKQFIITTHSEHIVSSALNSVSQKKLDIEDLKLFYIHKQKKQTIIEEQKINDKGQVEGGLKSFYQTDLKDIKDFFKIENKE
jgi:predicted ATPase